MKDGHHGSPVILNEPMEVKATAFPSITHKQAWTIAAYGPPQNAFRFCKPASGQS